MNIGELTPGEDRMIDLIRNRPDLVEELASAILAAISDEAISEDEAFRLFRLLFDEPSNFVTQAGPDR